MKPSRCRGQPSCSTFGLLLAGLLEICAIIPHVSRAQSPPADDFNPGANGSVRAIVLQPDGKIMVGGDFNILGGQTRNRLARLNPDGTLDQRFSTSAGNLDRVIGLALQPDGKLVVSGLFTNLAGQTRNRIGRLNADGTLDSSLDSGADNEILCLVLQPDGKIVVGGRFANLAGQGRSRIGRLSPDGTLDTTFNPGASGTVHCLAMQPDGKILAGGSFGTMGGKVWGGIGRLNADGTFDASFTPNLSSAVYCIALQPDGKILFSQDSGAAIGRLNSDGTLDNTFAGTSQLSATSIAIQTDGKILVGGQFTFMAGQPRNRLARLNSNGTLDAAFDSQTDGNGTVESLALQPDGNILVGGSFSFLAGQPRLRMARLINTDQATQTLSRAGSVITWLRGGSSPEVWRTTFEHSSDGLSWAFLGAGTRIAGGWELTNGSVPTAGIVRARGFVAEGERNASGWFVSGYEGFPTLVSQPESRTNNAETPARFWVVAGGSEPLSYRWFKDGIPLGNAGNVSGASSPSLSVSTVLKADEGAYWFIVSNSFGSVTSSVATLTVIEPLITSAPMATNRMLGETVALSVTAAGTALNYRWYRDGLLLTGAMGATLTLTNLRAADAGYYHVQVSNQFGIVVSLSVPLTVNAATVNAAFDPNADNSALTVACQSDGKILVGGTFTMLGGQARNRIARLNADGILDLAFDPSADAAVNCFALQPDGKIIVGGAFTTMAGQTRNRVARLKADGTLDFAFDPNASGAVNSLALQPDGKILIGGAFTTIAGTNRNRIARLNDDGTLDFTFDPGVGGTVNCLVLQKDGKILVGGQFTTLGGQGRGNIGRLDSTGTLDASFNPVSSGTVFSLTQQPDEKILVGGNFQTLGGQARSFVGRLHSDGSLDAGFNPAPNSRVLSMALRTDGKILLGGRFTALSGQQRNYIGQLNSSGTLDLGFNPSANNFVLCVAVQPDGQTLAGGDFNTVAGQARNRLVQLTNTTAVVQSLTYTGSEIKWLRSGAGPEVWRTAFEHSLDGSNWTFLSEGMRIANGWQLVGVSLPPTGVLRARGFIAGDDDGSRWFTETTLAAPWPVYLRLTHAGAETVLNWTGGRGPYQVQQATNVSQSSMWFDVGAPVETNAMLVPSTAPTLFFRIRE